ADAGASASASEFSGLAATNTLDQTATGTGNTSSLISATAPTTAQASELLVGAFGISQNGGDTLTPGSNGTANNCATSGSPTYTLLTPSNSTSQKCFRNTASSRRPAPIRRKAAFRLE
ncbi:MAG TPA: hypothetical protein VMW65_02320, partial [Chloroflexota bacterium]|nr:hypothetical protein [Chloroflexota bacterium]